MAVSAGLTYDPGVGGKGRVAASFAQPVCRAVLAWLLALCGCGTADVAQTEAKALDSGGPLTPVESETLLEKDGQLIFHYETFGDEVYWTETLGLHEIVERHADLTTALQVGLKLDADALPPGVLENLDLKN